ncbi:NADH-quinone oxidoreductase subunit NuoK [Desulfobaculum bizertense]|uniref:NADH-quinone oxidoreductase subunit K n=1 Tax=Desulfobaculum bizertense DSM 18034 TaxID=1121442 RepID=A0A1T4VWJ4_9BACT|nr:NADH-quinone oxidoreductase subunit K [Desulfobaculum bizertense]UIJ36815.1 NADH-quinone oxidoreductase subunit K [Desulfobaculum bizertense]SKA69373.1 NADH-quinone oxidoreductase subunit K [Desulfobaculum bizertense DSM 18034]
MSNLVLYQLVALGLLGIGLFGIVYRRTLVGMLICVELMLNGAGLSITAAGQLTEASATLSQLATLLVMGLAAAEATLVLAIILVVVKRFGSDASREISDLKG